MILSNKKYLPRPNTNKKRYMSSGSGEHDEDDLGSLPSDISDSDDNDNDNESVGSVTSSEYHTLTGDDENELELEELVEVHDHNSYSHNLLLNSFALQNYWNSLNLNLPNLPNLNLSNLPNLPNLNLPNLPNLSMNLPVMPNFSNLPNNLRSRAWKMYENGVRRAELMMMNRGDIDLDIISGEFTNDSFDWEDIFTRSTQNHSSAGAKGIKDPEEKYSLSLLNLNSKPSNGNGGNGLNNGITSSGQNSVLGEFGTGSSSSGCGSGDETDELYGFHEEPKVDDYDNEAVVLSEEFWNSIITDTTQGCSEMSISLPVHGSGNVVKAPLNPFFHRVNSSLLQRIKVWALIPIIPVKVVTSFFFLLLAWSFAMIATIGITKEELRSKPIPKWRRVIRWIVANIWMRCLFFCLGFLWVNKKGKQAKREDAPILVVAPHSSFFDAFPLILMGAPSIVSKASVADVPFFGKLVDLTQAVYVSREQKSSRTEVSKCIVDRATSKEDWPQIYIYPEGTCTNRYSLVSYKLGAFNPGVPVQPVIIKYPNHTDTLTWTFDGLPWSKVLFQSLSQFYLRCDLEFLPVYCPSEEEKSNPALFANNVRQVMADAMGAPISDYSYEDGVTMTQMKTDDLVQKLKEISKLRNLLKISSCSELNLVRTISSSGSNDWMKTTENFIQDFNLFREGDSELVGQLFKVIDKENTGRIDVREYFVYSCLLNHNVRVDKIIPVIFSMYGEGRKKMSVEGFTKLMERIFGMSNENANKFLLIGTTDESTVTTIDLDKFSKKLRKRLEYLRLYALEANDLLKVYPPRDLETNQWSKYHSSSTTTTNSNIVSLHSNNSKTKSD